MFFCRQRRHGQRIYFNLYGNIQVEDGYYILNSVPGNIYFVILKG
jgi:hypothetical protein